MNKKQRESKESMGRSLAWAIIYFIMFNYMIWIPMDIQPEQTAVGLLTFIITLLFANGFINSLGNYFAKGEKSAQ